MVLDYYNRPVIVRTHSNMQSQPNVANGHEESCSIGGEGESGSTDGEDESTKPKQCDNEEESSKSKQEENEISANHDRLGCEDASSETSFSVSSFNMEAIDFDTCIQDVGENSKVAVISIVGSSCNNDEEVAHLLEWALQL